MKANNPIIDMLNRQKAVNEIVAGRNWFEKGLDWRTAVVVEAGELIDSLDWKWWKHQDTDVDNAKIECVDIWHFVLSMVAEATIKQQIQKDSADEELNFIVKTTSNKEKKLDEKLVIEQVIQLISIVSENKNANFYKVISAVQKTCELSYSLDMDIEEVAKLYFGKSVLNEFRQRHGYKDGTYQKIWHGKEDNKAMIEMSNTLSYGPTFEENLNQMLEDMYLTVVE